MNNLDNKIHNKQKTILVVIANYGVTQILYLRKMIAEFSKFKKYTVDIIVHSNIEIELPTNIKVNIIITIYLNIIIINY